MPETSMTGRGVPDMREVSKAYQPHASAWGLCGHGKTPKLTSLCENCLRRARVARGAGYSAGSLLPSRLFDVENMSRPEGGCRLIARPTFETGVFTQTLTHGADCAPFPVRNGSMRTTATRR